MDSLRTARLGNENSRLRLLPSSIFVGSKNCSARMQPCSISLCWIHESIALTFGLFRPLEFNYRLLSLVMNVSFSGLRYYHDIETIVQLIIGQLSMFFIQIEESTSRETISQLELHFSSSGLSLRFSPVWHDCSSHVRCVFGQSCIHCLVSFLNRTVVVFILRMCHRTLGNKRPFVVFLRRYDNGISSSGRYDCGCDGVCPSTVRLRFILRIHTQPLMLTF